MLLLQDSRETKKIKAVKWPNSILDVQEATRNEKFIIVKQKESY